MMTEPLIPGGYILLSRKIIESEIWKKPPLYLKVWVYLLSKAQHADYKQLKRGQLRTSIPEIIEACSWRVGYRIEKPTKDQIYQILEWLRNGDEGGNESNDESNAKATMITTTKATHGLLITIDKYSVYQDSKNYESNDEHNDETATKATTKKLRKQRQPDNINKNDKNDKNDKNKYIYADFVSMTQDEHQKLLDEFGLVATNKMIETLNNYKGATGKKYKSDYLAIKNWVIDRVKKDHPHLFRQRTDDDEDFLKKYGFR